MNIFNAQKMIGKLFKYNSVLKRINIKYYSQKFEGNRELTISTKQDYLTFKDENKTMDFPLIWLRDNCQCEFCFHTISKSRTINWEHFDVNVKVANAFFKDNYTINILWSDNHSSDFCIDWLRDRSFLKNDIDNYNKNKYHPKKIEWGKNDFEAIFKNIEYDKILNDDSHFKNWLENLSIYGTALITNVPASSDSCRKLANKVEFIKKTHYGEEFVVKAKPGTTNVAYLSSNLQLHTDLPYYEYKPGVNLLHCVTQSKGNGGDNLLCDGHYVAKYLKMHHKKQFDILTKTLVNWEDIGEENGNKFHSIYKSPVICEDLDGEIVRINYSTPQRGSHFSIPLEDVKPWYESLKMFVDLIYQQSAKFKMEEGNILCFDNKRLLHGRTEYKDSQENVRYIIGAYLDWDYIYSRIRVLNEKLSS